LLTNTNPNLMY